MMTCQRHAQRGTFAVEFAVIFIVLLTFLFGVVELARLMYMYNMLQEVTRRAAYAAAGTNYGDQAAMRRVQQDAVFRDSAGELLLGAPVTDAYVLIDYLALPRNAGNSMTLTPIAQADLPASPATNRVNCTRNPNDAHCIRFVRVRICVPRDGTTCQPPNYSPLFGLFPSTIPLPMSTTIVPAETLGYYAGDLPGA